MHDLTCLLNGAAQCSLATVSAALPCPGLPEERHLAEAQDHRTRHRPDSPSSRSNSKYLFPHAHVTVQVLQLQLARHLQSCWHVASVVPEEASVA